MDILYFVTCLETSRAVKREVNPLPKIDHLSPPTQTLKNRARQELLIWDMWVFFICTSQSSQQHLCEVTEYTDRGVSRRSRDDYGNWVL